MTRTTFITAIPAAIAGWLGLKRWTPVVDPPVFGESGEMLSPQGYTPVKPSKELDNLTNSPDSIDWKLAQVNFAGKWYDLGTLGIIKIRDRSWSELSKEEQDDCVSGTMQHRTAEINLHSEGEFTTFRWLELWPDRPLTFRFFFGEIHGLISQRTVSRDENGTPVHAWFEITEKAAVPMPERTMGADGSLITHHPLSCHCGFCRDASGKQWPVMSTTMSIKPGYKFNG